VRVANLGADAFNESLNVTLVASTDTTFDVGDTPIVTSTKTTRLRAGASKNLKFSFTYPAVADNNYNVLAVVDPLAAVAESNDSNNTLAAAAPVTIAAPFVDLSASFAAPVPATVKRGGKLALAPLLQNLGNVTGAGAAEVSVFLSPDATLEPTDPLALVLTRRINLRAGAGKPQRLRVTVPDTLAAGAYTAFVVFNTVGQITETQAVNNIAAAPGTLAVT
jgi:hypothetical protein